MEDKKLNCVECSAEFIFTASEQEFYAEKGFQNEPKRCNECRQARKRNNRNDRNDREMHDVVCSECGKDCQVPFLPREDKPVYCNECFKNKREYRY